MAFIIMRSGLPLPVVKYLGIVSDQILPGEDPAITYKRIRIVNRPIQLTHTYEYGTHTMYMMENEIVAQVIFPNHPLFESFVELHTIHYPASG